MNQNEKAILDFAKTRTNFSKSEVFAYLSNTTTISRSSLSWYLNILTKKQLLVRVGRGLYAITSKNIFVPTITDIIKKTYSLLKERFPFAKFCIYDGNIISPLQHHLSQNNIIYIETNREAVESVFHFLRDNNFLAYMRPSKEMIYHYIDLGEEAYFIKPLVSESPLQTVQGIPAPTIEKLLIDIHKDKDFFYLQGSESSYIMRNALQKYAINENRLLRYAQRRGIKQEMECAIKDKWNYD